MPFIGLSAGRVTPTVESILTEAFQRAGYSSPITPALDRARDHWLEEVLREIGDEKRWHALEQTVVLIPVAYQAEYDKPAPLTRILRMRFYDGDERGTAVGGTIDTITVESPLDDAHMGRKVFLTGGTGAGQVNRIIGGSGTSVALCANDWTVQPDTTTTYMIANLELPIMGPVTGLPQHGLGPGNLITHWEEFDSQLRLYPSVIRSTYAVEVDGIVDVNTFDTTLEDGERLTRILREWRRAIVLGLMVRIYQDDKDEENADRYEAKFDKAVAKLKAADSRERRGLTGIAMQSVGGMPRRGS